MIQIRRSIFETNSSSTHSMSICTSDVYDKWMRGEMVHQKSTNDFYTRDELVNVFNNRSYYSSEYKEKLITKLTNLEWGSEELIEFLIDQGLYDFNSWCGFVEDMGYEPYTRKYQSPSGDNIVIFGYSGYSG